MRIAHIVPRYTPDIGGVETVVARLAPRLAAQGHHVEVLTQTANPSLPACETMAGVLVRRFPLLVRSQHYAFAPALCGYLARHSARYDLLHTHNYHALPALGAALTARCPVVFSPYYHGGSQARLRAMLHGLYRVAGAAMLRRVRHVICLSAAEAALIRKHFAVDAGRVSIIPSGIDVAALHAATPYLEDRTVILCAGRVEAYKNVDRVVAAMQHLGPSFALRVVGDGAALAALKAQAERRGLCDRVAFLGRVDDDAMRRWLRTASVYTSLSSHETFGITLWEALTAGAAVVASEIPAFCDVARVAGPDAITLVPLSVRAENLAQHIIDAAARNTTRRTRPLGLSWDDVATQTLALYARAVA